MRDWRDTAACAGRTDVDWDPEREPHTRVPPEAEEPALTLCRRCPVRMECLDDAMRVTETDDHGIRGGLPRRFRARLRRGGRVRMPLEPGAKPNSETADRVSLARKLRGAGWTREEIGQRLGVSPDTLTQMMTRANRRERVTA